MLVIYKNAEQALFQELKSCWETSPTWRCLQLKFSQLEQNKEDWLSDFMETLRSQIDEHACQIYVCHDQDAFILTRDFTNKRVSKLLTHLAPKLAPASLEGLAALFEIGVDWPKLRTICEKKIENLKILKQKDARQKQEEFLRKIDKNEALESINEDLIQTIGLRRQKRENPEIMVVEDDPFSQKLVQNALKNKYDLSISGDGTGALMSYVNKAPDILFLDIGLPDINGHEVLQKLFKLDPDAFVVMFSGNGDKENVMRAIQLGAKGFVAKPFTQEKLLQYIEKSPFIQAKKNKSKVPTQHLS